MKIQKKTKKKNNKMVKDNIFTIHKGLLFSSGFSVDKKIVILVILIQCISTLLFASESAYKPVLTSPAQNSRTFFPFPNFFWTAHPDEHRHHNEPVSYNIEIATDEKFSKVIDSDTVFLNRNVMDKPFNPGKYFWRVRATGGGEPGQWSTVGAFEITETDVLVTVPYKAGLPDYYDIVQKALSEAKRHSAAGRSVRLVFTKGNYQFDRANTPFINLNGVSNIIIDGSGSRAESLRLSSGLVQLENCTNIAVMNLDYDLTKEVPYSLATVTGIDKANSAFTIAVSPGFAQYDDPYFSRNFQTIQVLEPGSAGSEGRLRSGFQNSFPISEFTKLGERLWKYTYRRRPHHNDLIGELQIGDRIIHKSRGSGSPVTQANQCSYISYYNITSHASSGMQYVSLYSSYLHVLHCRAVLKEGWPYNGLADGLHMRGHQVGPWVEGCSFTGLGDDAIALFARPSTVAVAHPDGKENELLLNAEFMNLEAGDEVSFFNPKEGRILLECTVVAVRPEDKKFRVVFSGNIPENIATLVSEEPLSRHDVAQPDQIWNRSKSCGDFVVRNNTFRNIRRYGIVVRARRGVIENTAFEGCSSSAIALKNEPFWPNGLYGSEIIIRNNVINDCSFQHNAVDPLFIGFNKWDMITPGGFEDADGFGHRNIVIKDNTFTKCPVPEMVIVSSKNITIKDNKSGTGRKRQTIKATIRNSSEVVQ